MVTWVSLLFIIFCRTFGPALQHFLSDIHKKCPIVRQVRRISTALVWGNAVSFSGVSPSGLIFTLRGEKTILHLHLAPSILWHYHSKRCHGAVFCTAKTTSKWLYLLKIKGVGEKINQLVSMIWSIHDSASLVVDCKSWPLWWDSLVPSTMSTMWQ